ncbi:MAG: hypothetical protein ACLFPH_07140 [Bacteroidales bacterium]
MFSEEALNALENIPDEVLQNIQFAMPWQEPTAADKQKVDEDGFPMVGGAYGYSDMPELQLICWEKFNKNPQISLHVRDVMGNLCGNGFEVTSEVDEINDTIENIFEDPRNNLWINMPKYVARGEIEGELFKVLTCHKDGFVEIDFLDPSSLVSGDDGTGIIFHPTKANFPLGYLFKTEINKQIKTVCVPSINVAYFPELKKTLLEKVKDYDADITFSEDSNNKFKSLGGYYRFIISWDKGFFTPRNVSHIRTTIEWLNWYEELKKYEIDHKKSAGSYLWVGQFTDLKSFRLWLSLSNDEKKKTGLMQKKTPGGTLLVPPGMDFKCVNPQLQKISEQDTDILQMVTSGLGKPEDMMTGSMKGTQSGVQAGRGPVVDRTQNEIEYFRRYLKQVFFRSIFYLKQELGVLKKKFKVLTVVGYEDVVKDVEVPDAEGNIKKVKQEIKEPKKKYKMKPAYQLVDFSFPTSEVGNMEGRARALLGSKHGSIVETLGIPKEEVASKLGFGNYKRLRLRKSEEDLKYPAMLTNVEQESIQERNEGEKRKPGNEGKKNSNDRQREADRKKELKRRGKDNA